LPIEESSLSKAVPEYTKSPPVYAGEEYLGRDLAKGDESNAFIFETVGVFILARHVIREDVFEAALTIGTLSFLILTYMHQSRQHQREGIYQSDEFYETRILLEKAKAEVKKFLTNLSGKIKFPINSPTSVQ